MTRMFIGIRTVSIPVDNLDEALHFYCEVLGMEKRKDVPIHDREGNRHVEVAPPGSPTALSPYTFYDRPPKVRIGEYARVVLKVEDVRATYAELNAKGVRFEGEPFEAAGGVYAAMRDPWDNYFIIADDTLLGYRSA
jgi:catechol 2,3-dioxygenase-like lactoylglutathione lyase family enzyme